MAKTGPGQDLDLKPKKVLNQFPDFAAFLSYMDGLGLFSMNPGLERTRAVLRRLGLERLPYTAVQVVGTNGKGSSSAMLAQLAEEYGLKTGLYTSPHFVSLRERVRINRTMLSEADWTSLANKLLRAGAGVLSWFEFTTCLCVLAFAEAGVDLAVMESGLGGTYDAVTATPADLVIFTPIALDHEFVLGSTLAAIAADKAGAMRPGVTALSGPQDREAMAELEKYAALRACPLHKVEVSSPLPFAPGQEDLTLHGRHQLGNARLALTAFHILREKKIFPPPLLDRLARAEDFAGARHSQKKLCQRQLEARALSQAFMPGRMQRIPAAHVKLEQMSIENVGKNLAAAAFPLGRPTLLLDGAHNPHGLAALGASLATEGTAPAAVIFSCLRDKDLERMLPHLRVLSTGPIFIPPIQDNPRAAQPEDLAARIGLDSRPVSSLLAALGAASSHIIRRLPEALPEVVPGPPPDTLSRSLPGSLRVGMDKNPLLVCGSLYLLGEFYALFPQFLEAPPWDA
ncbi:MAG: bifunctional folylpolyglutamate synthase/dihydrofolate synthase [Desulfovibrio sp.]|jgi:dihydrofolate synthase/folylpolyglutamate synthase|nr:bifunctional folylpolyglutamate synthase/dihydrofolate synthase [Desulfovibrio sp.]